MYHNGTWGTVCDNRIAHTAATVVCSMLGFGYVGQVTGNRYGAGSGPIWLDSVHCSGTEKKIRDCRHGGWGQHNCEHRDDVSVSCNTSVRLVDGPSPREGRLEVYHNGTWGTVCDEGFSNPSARVVCYMLRFGYGGQVIANRYGAGSGPIWLDDVRCNGTETDIGHCRHGGWGRDYGRDSECEYVSVSCNTSVRLVGGPNPREGRLEVYKNGTWKTVCDNRYSNRFTHAEARVVCFMLGYVYTGRFIGTRYGAGSGRICLDVQCNGTEIDIGNCRYRAPRSHYSCAHVSVSCPTPLRLVGGTNSREGRLEVYYNGTWGTVCDKGFSHASARVVCYVLRFGYDGQVIGNRYGAGSGLIWLDNVRCNGSETKIEDCRHNSWGSHYCGHSLDVSVSCSTSVRLVAGPSPREGRLELYHNRTWGTVCNDYSSHSAARVVCYMLGYGRTGRSLSDRYGAGSEPILLNYVRCSGTETDIEDCPHSDWGRHYCRRSILL